MSRSLHAPSWLRELIPTAVACAVIFCGRASFADHYTVPSGSMTPTVLPGDRVFVNKSAYALRIPGTDRVLTETGAPQRGDVVVLQSPDQPMILLKRLVGLPGDRVSVRNGILELNGQPVEHQESNGQMLEQLRGELRPHSLDLSDGGGPDWGPVTLTGYLVLGDHRGDSRDGRFFGLVRREQLLGRALGVFQREGHFGWNRL